MAYMESAFIQSRVNILIYQQKSYLQIASTTQSIRCFVVQMETKISLNKSMMIAIWRKKWKKLKA